MSELEREIPHIESIGPISEHSNAPQQPPPLPPSAHEESPVTPLIEDPTGAPANELSRELPPEIRSLLLWENPVRSAGLLAVNIFATWVFFLSGFPFMTVFAYFMLSVLLVNMGWVHLKAALDSAAARTPTHPYQQALSEGMHLPREALLQWVLVGFDWLEALANQLADIVLARDTPTTAMAAVGLYFTAWLGVLLGTGGLLLLFQIAAFAVPPVYHRHHDKMEPHIERLHQVQQKASEWFNQRIPKKLRPSPVERPKQE
eukprot:comp21759_c0_seq1/m.30836 comp21759_c0_seq1/g.30836  ORF comp21759_c0_seq1/g.30836 comp21759_c0_seq1/m.30836 type:complete len:260 (-) comp21759_c0_seq1:589-1368(-)